VGRREKLDSNEKQKTEGNEQDEFRKMDIGLGLHNYLL